MTHKETKKAPQEHVNELGSLVPQVENTGNQAAAQARENTIKLQELSGQISELGTEAQKEATTQTQELETRQEEIVVNRYSQAGELFLQYEDPKIREAGKLILGEVKKHKAGDREALARMQRLDLYVGAVALTTNPEIKLPKDATYLRELAGLKASEIVKGTKKTQNILLGAQIELQLRNLDQTNQDFKKMAGSHKGGVVGSASIKVDEVAKDSRKLKTQIVEETDSAKQKKLVEEFNGNLRYVESMVKASAVYQNDLGRIEKLDGQIAGFESSAKDAETRAQKPENAQERDAYLQSAQIYRNKITVLEGAKATILGAKTELDAAIENRGEYRERLGRAKSLLAYSDFLEHEGMSPDPGVEVTQAAMELKAKPELLLTRENKGRFDSLRIASSVGLAANAQITVANKIIDQVGASEDLTKAQKKQAKAWVSKGIELCTEAYQTANKKDASKAELEAARSKIMLARLHMDGANKILETTKTLDLAGFRKTLKKREDAREKHGGPVSRRLKKWDSEGEATEKTTKDQLVYVETTITRAMELRKESYQLAQTALKTEDGEAAAEITEKSLLLLARSNLLISELPAYMNGLEQLESAKKSFRGNGLSPSDNSHMSQDEQKAADHKAKLAHLTALRSNIARIGNGIARLSEKKEVTETEINAAIGTIGTAAQNLEKLEVENQVSDYEYRIRGFAPNKTYTKNLWAAAVKTREILNGEGKWGDLGFTARKAAASQQLLVATTYATQFIVSGWANCKTRENGTKRKHLTLPEIEADVKERGGRKTLPSELARRYTGRALAAMVADEEGPKVQKNFDRGNTYARKARDGYSRLAQMGFAASATKEKIAGMGGVVEEEKGGQGQVGKTGAQKAKEEMGEAGVEERARDYGKAVWAYEMGEGTSETIASAKTKLEGALALAENNREGSILLASSRRKNAELVHQIDKLDDRLAKQEHVLARAQATLAMEYGDSVTPEEKSELLEDCSSAKRRKIKILETQIKQAKATEREITSKIDGIEAEQTALAKRMGQPEVAEKIQERRKREQKRRELKREELVLEIEGDESIEKAIDDDAMMGSDTGINDGSMELAARARYARKKADLDKRMVENENRLATLPENFDFRKIDPKNFEGVRVAIADAHHALEDTDAELPNFDLAAECGSSVVALMENDQASRTSTAGILRKGDVMKDVREGAGAKTAEEYQKAAHLAVFGGKRFMGDESVSGRMARTEGPKGSAEERRGRAIPQKREANKKSQEVAALTTARTVENAQYDYFEPETAALDDVDRIIRKGPPPRPPLGASAKEHLAYEEASRRYANERNGGAQVVDAIAIARNSSANGGTYIACSSSMEDHVTASNNALHDMLVNRDELSPVQIAATVAALKEYGEVVLDINDLAQWAELGTLGIELFTPVGGALIVAKIVGGGLEMAADTGSIPPLLLAELALMESGKLAKVMKVYRTAELIGWARTAIPKMATVGQKVKGTFSLARSLAFNAAQAGTLVYFTGSAVIGAAHGLEEVKRTGRGASHVVTSTIFTFLPAKGVVEGKYRAWSGKRVSRKYGEMTRKRYEARKAETAAERANTSFMEMERSFEAARPVAEVIPVETRAEAAKPRVKKAAGTEAIKARSLERAKKKITERIRIRGREGKLIPKEGAVRPARAVEAAPKAEAEAEARKKEYKTRKERQDASFMERHSVEWAEKTIAENRPEANETAENQRLRYLAFNRIAKEPVEVRSALKKRTLEATPKELRGVVGVEWKLYVDGMIPGLNEYSPVREMPGFKAIPSEKLAPKIKSDVDGFLRNADGANAHGVAHDKGGHERFTDVILRGEIPQTAWVGPMKKGPGVDRSTSSAFHGPFWVVLEGKAGAKKGPITAKEHVAYICPSEKHMVESSRAVKDAYSQGKLTRTEAVEALSKLMGAAEAKDAPATSFGSRAARTAKAKEFWAERNALAEGEIVSFERFSGMKVEKAAPAPKKNIVERMRELRAEEKRTGRPSMERARLERQIEQNQQLKEAVKEYERTERVLKRAKSGKQLGAVGDVEGLRKEQETKAAKAKANAGENLVDAEAAAKPAKPSAGMTRATKALEAMKRAKERAKERILALGRLPAKIKRLRKQRRAEKRAQVLTPEGERVKVPQEQAENASKRMQDTIFKTTITDAGMRSKIGLERGSALAKNAWAEVYRGEAKPTFRTQLEKDAYVAMKKQVQARFEQVVDYAWRDTIREKTHLRKRTKKPAKVNDAEMAVYLRMKKVFNTIWEANVKRKGMNKKSVEKMINPQELAVEYSGYLQRGAGMPKEMLAKVQEMGIETTITLDGKFVTNVKDPSGKVIFGDLHGDHTCPANVLKKMGFIIDTRPDLAVGDTSIAPRDRYIMNKELAQGTQIIFLGDYIDRGPHSLYAVDFVQWLKAEVGTLENGSHVHTLKGNHEAIFNRVFNVYKNKSTAEVEGLIGEIEAYKTARDGGRDRDAELLANSGQMGELRKEGIALERIGTEAVLKEALDRYGTWGNAVVEMGKDGGLMHFIGNTKGAVILEAENGNYLYAHAGLTTKTAAREADGTIIRTTDGKIVYNEIKSAKELDKHFTHFFEKDSNRWAQNGIPTDPVLRQEAMLNAREAAAAGDYSVDYVTPEKSGGWVPESPTSKAGQNLDTFARNLNLVEIGVGHLPGGEVRSVGSQEMGNGKRTDIIAYDAANSGAYGKRFGDIWKGGQAAWSTTWGRPGERNNTLNSGRKNDAGVVEKPAGIKNSEFSAQEMETPYAKAWEQTEGVRMIADDVTIRVPTITVAPQPAPKATPKQLIAPKRPVTTKPARRTTTKKVAPAKPVKKGHPEMPENIEKWVDPETQLPWSKLKGYLESRDYTKKFTVPVDIKGEFGEWVITIEGITTAGGKEICWYTVSSWPANIEYTPGHTTGAVVLEKGASLKNLITKNIQKSFKETGSSKKTGVIKPAPAVKSVGGEVEPAVSTTKIISVGEKPAGGKAKPGKAEAEGWPRARALEAEKELILADLDKTIATRDGNGKPVPQGRVVSIEEVKAGKVFRCKIKTADGKEAESFYTTTDFRQQEIGLRMYEAAGETALGYVSLDGKRALQQDVGQMSVKEALAKAKPGERAELLTLLGRQGVIDYALGIPDAHGENYIVNKTAEGWKITRIDLENSGEGWGRAGRYWLNYHYKFAYNLKAGLRTGKYSEGDLKSFIRGVEEGIQAVGKMDSAKIMESVSKYEGTPLKKEHNVFTRDMRMQIGERIEEIRLNPEKTKQDFEASMSPIVRDSFLVGYAEGKTNISENQPLMEWFGILKKEASTADLNALLEWRKDVRQVMGHSKGEPPKLAMEVERSIDAGIRSRLKEGLSEGEKGMLLEWRRELPRAKDIELFSWRMKIRVMNEFSEGKLPKLAGEVEGEINQKIIDKLQTEMPTDWDKIVTLRREVTDISNSSKGELSVSARNLAKSFENEIFAISEKKYLKEDVKTVMGRRDVLKEIGGTAEGKTAARARELEAKMTTRLLEGAGKRINKKATRGKEFAAESELIEQEVKNGSKSDLEALRDSLKGSAVAERFAREIEMVEAELRSRT
ncbi:MAG: hypothetical protein GY852_06495 [bacterium]|nr:hypothetical protein [bacterium]